MEYVYPFIERVALTTVATMGYEVTIIGEDNIPTEGGAVLASNHIGYLDFVFTGLAAFRRKRRVRFLAKKEVWNNKVAKVLMNGMRHIPVDRAAAPAQAYEAAVASLQQGEIIGMFPESTISPSFVPRAGKTGSARLARSAGVPLIPAAVWGTQRILTKGRPKNLQRKLSIIVNVGAPIDSEGDPRAITDDLMDRITILLKEAQARYPQSPNGDDDRWWLPAHLGGTAPTPEEAERILEAARKERAERKARD
ncbi:MAG TPA: lysophospholipid acyltransferase family protein [Actinomycetota bacterium]|nr:lysophospholipid acyltransferase family protein [Actinomycetota bacterium]